MKRLCPLLASGVLFVVLGQSASTTRSAGLATPSEAARRVLAHPAEKPGESDLADLKPSDEAFLREKFESQPLSNRIAAAFALAHLSGEAALATLRKPLEQTDVSPITGGDEKALVALLFATGRLAQRSDAAFEYLRSRTRLEQWKHAGEWAASGPAIRTDLLLCAASLRALATTGRTGIKEEIERFEDQFSVEEIQPIAGVIVDAAFYQWYTEKYGLTALNDIVWTERMTDAWRLFTQTETGRRWSEWRKSKLARPQ